MLSIEAIEENFRFLMIEVTKQLEDTLKVFSDPKSKLVTKIRERDNYIDNLKGLIESKSFSKMLSAQPVDKKTVDVMRAMIIITSNLERIGDHAVSIVEQMKYFTDADFLERYDHKPFFQEIFSSLESIFKAIDKRDIARAMKICRSELILDQLYKATFDRIMAELKTGRDTENLITTLFVYRYLERIGDCLLNIGEAIIFSIIGEKFKIDEFRVLEETLALADMSSNISDMELESIWGSRSGCRISHVHSRESDANQSGGVIFKHGLIRKVAREKENIERWETLSPGLPPRIVGFQSDAGAGALLLEYLGGQTLQDITLNGKAIKNEAFGAMENTVLDIWRRTMRPEQVSAQFVTQLKARLPEVYQLHPYFKKADHGHTVADEMLEKLEDIDKELKAPFTIFIHGDFNVNNIIYNEEQKKIHYIDLYRSGDGDYIQDVSVFMVSNFRLPIFEPAPREILNRVIVDFYHFAKTFAEENNDRQFFARLTLGLIRSFITSTRFEYRKDFARTMFTRGVVLMKKLLDHEGKPWESFELPVEDILY